MGIYFGVYEKPCVRCGEGVVGTTFISANNPMSFHARCGACEAEDFTQDELIAMGQQKGASWA